MLQDITNYGKWSEHSVPYRHFRASNVLSDEDYLRVSSNFHSLLNYSDEHDGDPTYQFNKSNLDYDAEMLQMKEHTAPLFDPFFTGDFVRSVADFLKIPFIPKIHCGLHSNAKNSRTGWLHTDHCSGWFDENTTPNGPLLFQADCGCEYFRGHKKRESAQPAEYVRVATLLFYLCNDGWEEGDGGTTGLFEAWEMNESYTSAFIPPINNSLLLFECTPTSYHRFMTNPGRRRNSLILGLHATLEHAQTLWGDDIKRRSTKK